MSVFEAVITLINTGKIPTKPTKGGLITGEVDTGGQEKECHQLG